jgi:NADPH:quinone reductase-like Zn-dependent oxidoreductase
MRGWVEQMTAIMMQVVRYHQFGGPEVLKLEQVPRPEPKEDEVLIRIM